MNDNKEVMRLIDANGQPCSQELHLKVLKKDTEKAEYRTFTVDKYIGKGTSVIVYKGHYIIGEMQHDCIIKELYPENCEIHRNKDGVTLDIGLEDDYEVYKKKYSNAYKIQLEAQNGRMYKNTTVDIKDKDGNKSKQIVYSQENLSLNRSIAAQYGVYESDSGILYAVYASNLCYPYDKYPPETEEKDSEKPLSYPRKETAKESITFALQAARVLAAFHKIGWLIFDIKEENFIITGTDESAGILFIDLGSIVNKSDLNSSDGTTELVSFTPKSKNDLPLELKSLLIASEKKELQRIYECHHDLAERGDATDMYLLAAMLYRKLIGRSPGEEHPVGEPELSEQQAFYDELKKFFNMAMNRFASQRSSDDEIIKQLELLLDLSGTVDERTRTAYINSGMTQIYTGVTNDHMNNSSKRYYERLGSSEKFAQLKKIVQKFDTKVHLLDKNNEEVSAEKIFEGKRHIFLEGSGGMGKSTLLYNQWGRLLSENRQSCLYIDLSRYADISNSVEQGNSLRDGINRTPLNILAYIINNILRDNSSSLSAHLDDNDQAKSLLERFTADKPQPEYLIMLDGYNEILDTVKRSILNNEIDMIVHGENPWKNVQLVITGRKLPEDHDLKGLLDSYFDTYTFTGITDDDISAALVKYMKMSSEKMELLKKDRLWEILKTPMFLNMYLEINDSSKALHTRGEILEEYILNREVRTGERISVENERNGSHAIMRNLIVRYALPYAASLMDRERKLYLSIYDFESQVEKGYDIFRTEKAVFRCYTKRLISSFANAPKILDDDSDILIDMIGNETGYYYVSDGNITFSHEYIRDYLAARHIYNVLDAAKAQGELIGDFGNEKQLEFIKANGLDYVWSDEIALLLGDITKDYLNDPEYSETSW